MSLQVGVIMGSKSDWETMKHACDVLDELEIAYEKKVVSAHRTPDLMFEYAEKAVRADSRSLLREQAAPHICPEWLQPKRCFPSLAFLSIQSLNGLIPCCRSFRCQAAFRSQRWRSAKRGQRMQDCWPLRLSGFRSGGASDALKRAESASTRSARKQ